MIMMRLFTSVLIVAVLASGAWGAGLSEKDVRGFVASMHELKPYFDQYADEVGDGSDASGTAQVVSDWAKSLRQQHELEGLLAKHGFDFESWAAVSQQVTQAYMALKFGQSGQDVVGQMRQTMAEIEANKDIPAESKEQILGQMRQSMAEMEAIFSASPEDQAMVRPFVSDLDTIFEWHE